MKGELISPGFCSLPRALKRFRYIFKYSGFPMMVTAAADRELATSHTCTVLVANAGVICNTAGGAVMAAVVAAAADCSSATIFRVR